MESQDHKNMTHGQKAVGLSFNPSGDTEVQQIKEMYAAIIDQHNDARNATTDPERKRMYSLAITEAQVAQMWAVKAATWKFSE